MPDIRCDLPIRASRERVFDAVSTPAGLDRWWTDHSEGTLVVGGEFLLHFGPGYDWRATVTRCAPPSEFELRLVQADPDWDGTRVGFVLHTRSDATLLQFYHTGWPNANDHWRVSCYCWPAYLRLLRRHLEYGEVVAYDQRLDV